MSQPSPLYRLIEAQLDNTLHDFIAQRRLPTKSWREIAEEIRELTGEQVNPQTLRNWFGDQQTSGDAS